MGLSLFLALQCTITTTTAVNCSELHELSFKLHSHFVHYLLLNNLDHLITNYTCKRKTNRWPMVLFMNMLDVGGIASLVVWLDNNPTWNENVLGNADAFSL